MASTRLPNKPMSDLAGKPMIERVWHACSQSQADEVWVASDSQQVLDWMSGCGAKVMLTATHHATGTDRLAEVVTKLALNEDQVVVNVQGDEPCMPLALIEQVATLLAAHPQASLATLYEPLTEPEQWHNPNVVKLVTDDQQSVLYFSRAAIPHHRDRPEQAWQQAKRHLGIYAYRVSALKQFSQLPASSLEQMESLEQLRFLQSGLKVVATKACQALPAGVDTPEDLARMQQFFATLDQGS